jgi:hypothetical protein
MVAEVAAAGSVDDVLAAGSADGELRAEHPVLVALVARSSLCAWPEAACGARRNDVVGHLLR